jgi:hypothetical protein
MSMARGRKGGMRGKIERRGKKEGCKEWGKV